MTSSRWCQRGWSLDFLNSKALKAWKEEKRDKSAAYREFIVFKHLLSTYCVSSTALCVRNAMLKIMTEGVELLNSSIVSIFTRHSKFHAQKRNTQDKKELCTAQEVGGSSRTSLRALKCPGTVEINNLLRNSEEQNWQWEWANAVLMFKSERVKDAKNCTAISVMSVQAR